MKKFAAIVILLLTMGLFLGCGSGKVSRKDDKRLVICVAGTANKSGVKKFNNVSEFSSQIFNSSLQKTKAFRIIERDRLADILKELNIRDTGLLDLSKSKQVGKMLGADALFFVNLLDVTQKERGKSTLTGLISDDSNKIVETLSVIIEGRLVDVETGEILASSKETVDMKNIYKKSDKKSKMDVQSTLNKAIEKCSESIADDIASQVE